ncbi:MAG: dihydroorotase [Bdellovibrionales bacterium]|nr:dihydroorotase [Bdellovibrionales bacterium]
MAHFDYIIKNATCILRNTSKNWTSEVLDVGIQNGKIQSLKAGLSADAETFDATGLHLLPGLIDTQVHFRQPGLEHKETIATGLKGAALGGITGVFEMPNTAPPTDCPERLQEKLAIASKDPWANYAFFAGATPENIPQLNSLELTPGCCGVKVFMGSSTGSLLISTEELLDGVLKNGKRRVAIHSEDEALLVKRFKSLNLDSKTVFSHPEWRNEEVALTSTKKLVRLAKLNRRPVHVLHVTTAEEMAFLKQEKEGGLVTVETTPQHLTLYAPDCYERLGTLAQMNPPIRDKKHQEALWKAINDGTVDVLGSDHAPHTIEEKNRPYPKSPSGMTGVQTTVPLMLDHVNHKRLSLYRLVELLAERPCQIYGIKNKGALQVGRDADFTLVDLKTERIIENSWIASLAGWSPFDGKKVMGWPKGTMIGGNWTMLEDQLQVPLGRSFEFEF